MIEANLDNYINLITEMKQKNARLIQICCTKTDLFEITYSFEVDNEVRHIRLSVNESQEIESICGIFSPSFLYEIEMKDLFGLKINHITPDFNGTLYKLAAPAPFSGTI